jgi:DNA-binding NtrC family response regulator
MNASKRQQRPVILLVEEDGRVRRDVAHHLTEHGFEVIEASDSDEALAALEGRTDVRGFVTDAHVPGRLDGFELAGVVRERWPAIGVVMMSGHSDASSGPIPPGGEFIAKPYLFEYLAPNVRKFGERT